MTYRNIPRTPHGKANAIRASRILETAVGAALGTGPKRGPGRGNKTSLAGDVFLNKDDTYKFRRMYEHRELWWPELHERPLSRAKVLQIIDDANKPTYAERIVRMRAWCKLEQGARSDLANNVSEVRNTAHGTSRSYTIERLKKLERDDLIKRKHG